MTKTVKKPATQVVGNIGLYQVCMELSKLGLNVMPTARNARGVDVLGYGAKGKSFTVSVKTLSRRVSVPFGNNKGSRLFADFFILVVLGGPSAGAYVWSREEMRRKRLAHNKDGSDRLCYWLESKVWGKDPNAFGAWSKVTKSLGKARR